MIAPPKNPSSRINSLDWLLILVFGVVIALPTLDYFTHVDITQAPEENRLMAPWPHLASRDLSGVQHYLAGAESYFNDHFGFRKRLVRWCQQWKYRLFRVQTANLVITGQSGWLYISEREMIKHYQGELQFTLPELHDWRHLLETRRDWLAARGIKYLFVIPPDKQTIYPENLPAWLLKATPPGRRTKLDQFMEYMNAHSTVHILDLREPLLAARKIAPVYLQHDTHWNLYGGFIGCQSIVRALSGDLPGLRPLRLEDFVWANVPTNGGDLARAAGLDSPEKNCFVFTPKPGVITPRLQDATNILRVWNPKDPNKLNAVSENPSPAVAPFDAVVFHDSYGRAMRPFLGCSFHRITWIFDNREFDAAIIIKNHPSVVISEMLERFLNTEGVKAMQTGNPLP